MGVSDQAAHQSLAQWFNPAAFAPPAPFTYGNASRTIPNIMSDGMVDFDFSLYKDFALTERFKLQLKGEAFHLRHTRTGRDLHTPGNGDGHGS